MGRMQAALTATELTTSRQARRVPLPPTPALAAAAE